MLGIGYSLPLTLFLIFSISTFLNMDLIFVSRLQVVRFILLFAKFPLSISALLRTGFASLTRRPTQKSKKNRLLRRQIIGKKCKCVKYKTLLSECFEC